MLMGWAEVCVPVSASALLSCVSANACQCSRGGHLWKGAADFPQTYPNFGSFFLLPLLFFFSFLLFYFIFFLLFLFFCPAQTTLYGVPDSLSPLPTRLPLFPTHTPFPLPSHPSPLALVLKEIIWGSLLLNIVEMSSALQTTL